MCAGLHTSDSERVLCEVRGSMPKGHRLSQTGWRGEAGGGGGVAGGGRREVCVCTFG